MNIYNISLDTVSFSFSQTDRNHTQTVTADVTAEVAGNAAKFYFSDSAGNSSSGNLIFDNGQLYVKIVTSEPVSAVFPSVDCIMSRNQVQLVPDPTATPTPMPQDQQISQTGEYFFPESNSRYLTDDEVSVYSSAQLELAKNEIYARHGNVAIFQIPPDSKKRHLWFSIHAFLFHDMIYDQFPAALFSISHSSIFWIFAISYSLKMEPC